MIEANNNRILTTASSKPLHLEPRSMERGMARQTFSRGRSKVVVVEKVKRRGPGAGETKPVSPAASSMAAPVAAARLAPATQTAQPSALGRPDQTALRPLTGEEQKVRARALVDARMHEEQERRRAAAEAAVRAEREERERKERAAAEAREREAQAFPTMNAEANARRPSTTGAPKAVPAVPTSAEFGARAPVVLPEPKSRRRVGCAHGK